MDKIPTTAMSPPHFPTSNHVIELRSQFPMKNERFEHVSFDQSHFKRARISDKNHSNAAPRMNHHHHQPSNKGTSHIFFKTRICDKFRNGNCRNGENCTFAHGTAEIRQPPPNWQQMVALRGSDQRVQQIGVQQMENWDEDQKIIHKMKLCKKFYNGEVCPYGDKCNFLHEKPAKFRDDSCNQPRECNAISIATIVSPTITVDGNKGKGTNWKTRLCLTWKHSGNCPFGEECHYAHGEHELQVPGGGIEAETAAALANATKAAILPTAPNVVSVSANVAASVLITKEEERKARQKLIWEKLSKKKIKGIYGDWIDDLD